MRHIKTGSNQGFTIVELIVTIVVIAILATLSISAYNGMQRNARNSATVAAAEQSLKLLQLYKTFNNGSYPSGYWQTCFGEYEDDVCMYFNNGTQIEAQESDTLKSDIATVGTMPQPTTKKFKLNNGRIGGGIVYYAGVEPKRLRYYLEGLNQNCDAGGTASNETEATLCETLLP